MNASPQAVFLSYASQDADAARKICDALRAAGVEVWFDQSELRGGDAWDQKIRRQIRECTLFLPVVSTNTQARREGYFRLEWKLADDRTHLMAKGTPFLLPVCVDNTKDWDALVPDSFMTVQWTRLPGGETPAKFCERVQSLLSRNAEVESGRPRSGERGSAFAEALADKEGTASLGKTRAANRRWFLPALVGLAAIAALAIWQPWKSASQTTANAPVSEARQLTLKARALIDDDLMAVRENFRLAEELCQRAVILAPDDGEAWATLARISAYMISAAYDTSAPRREAVRSQAGRAIRLAPESIEAGLAISAYLTMTGEFATAETRLRELLKRAPMDGRVVRALAAALVALEKSIEASEIRRTHRTLAGEDPRNLTTEAGIVRRRGHYVQAEELVDRAQAITPSRSGYMVKLLILGSDWGDLQAAKAYAEKLPPQLLQEDLFTSLVARLWLRFLLPRVRFDRTTPPRECRVMRRRSCAQRPHLATRS